MLLPRTFADDWFDDFFDFDEFPFFDDKADRKMERRKTAMSWISISPDLRKKI